MKLNLKRPEIVFLLIVFITGAAFRLVPRLFLDPHLLTFHADIWYRLCLAQYVIDTGHLPVCDIRYLSYGCVPFWYTPLSLYFFAFLHHLTQLDLPTVCSRIMPFVEALAVIPTYFLCRALYNKRVARIAAGMLTFSPAFIYWAGISTPQTFTIFFLPITILLWVDFVRGQFLFRNRWVHLLMMGAILTVNFLLHLSYFTHIIVLFLVQLGLIIEKKAHGRDYLYLMVPVLISQALTAWWWFPPNLYWWWSVGMQTASGLTAGLKFLTEYGVSSAILGHGAFLILVIYIISKRRAAPAYYLVPVLWALFPMFETHNENFFFWLNRFIPINIHTTNFYKPLEGFRFYLFAAQPLAICFALVADRLLDIRFFKDMPARRTVFALMALLISGVLVYDMFFIYKLHVRLNNAGIEIRDIRAAQWFRAYSRPTDRILSEYYTAQMFSGICGGRAMLGFLFPLRESQLPYIDINRGHTAGNDIYAGLYTSYDIKEIRRIFSRYKGTHLYLSDKILYFIERFTNDSKRPGEALLKIDKAKLISILTSGGDFRVVYQQEDVMIFERTSVIRTGPVK